MPEQKGKRFPGATKAAAIAVTTAAAAGTAGLATIAAGALTGNAQTIPWGAGILAFATGSATAALTLTLADELFPDNGQETESTAYNLSLTEKEDGSCNYSGPAASLRIHDPAIAAAPPSAITVIITANRD